MDCAPDGAVAIKVMVAAMPRTVAGFVIDRMMDSFPVVFSAVAPLGAGLGMSIPGQMVNPSGGTRVPAGLADRSREVLKSWPIRRRGCNDGRRSEIIRHGPRRHRAFGATRGRQGLAAGASVEPAVLRRPRHADRSRR